MYLEFGRSEQICMHSSA